MGPLSFGCAQKTRFRGGRPRPPPGAPPYAPASPPRMTEGASSAGFEPVNESRVASWCAAVPVARREAGSYPERG